MRIVHLIVSGQTSALKASEVALRRAARERLTKGVWLPQ